MNAFAHFCRYAVGLDGPDTQVTDSELSVILKYSREAKVLVEIGCYEGATTAALAASAPAGQVYSIDPFFKGRLGICYGYWIVRMQLLRKGIHNVRLIRALSEEAVKKFAPAADFLFIDGDHSFQAIERDWSAWFPKVKSGGVIAMHDCRISKNSPIELGTMRFYRECLPRWNGLREVDGADSLAVFQKLQVNASVR